MNSRVVVLTLIASLASSSLAFAEESLLQSGFRIVGEVGRVQAPLGAAHAPANDGARAPALVNRTGTARGEALLAQEQPVLSKSGMSKKTKFMIYAAAGVGFGLAAYAIDHKVLNITPSTLGTRKD